MCIYFFYIGDKRASSPEPVDLKWSSLPMNIHKSDELSNFLDYLKREGCSSGRLTHQWSAARCFCTLGFCVSTSPVNPGYLRAVFSLLRLGCTTRLDCSSEHLGTRIYWVKPNKLYFFNNTFYFNGINKIVIEV